MPTTSGGIGTLNWPTTDISQEDSLGPVNWKALVQYAIDVKSRRDGIIPVSCQLSAEYNMGGRNLVRRLDFHDNTRWIVRIQLHETTSQSTERLVSEIYTMAVVRERSGIPVPEVYAYEANRNNAVAVPFMIMEFMPGDTAMDSFGGYAAHKGKTPPRFKAKFHTAMADIQVQMSAIRFPKIGSIVKCDDGTYTVGPLPGIGGPFHSAAQFLAAWADKARFPYSEKVIRERTPSEVVDEVLRSIKAFPSRVKELAQGFPFREGPFPLFHTDFYNSNIIIDSEYDILSVIDWEGSFIVPWELVEFAKDLIIVPSAMDGPLYHEDEARRQRLEERMNYVKFARQAELSHGLDNKLSATLEDTNVQHFAHAMWLYETGRIGFYGDVLDELVKNRRFCH